MINISICIQKARRKLNFESFMDSRNYGVPLSATPVPPKAAAATGIRAPLTIDESDFEYSSRRNSITSSYGSGESEGFLSGDDDFENASKISNLPEKGEGSFGETHFFKDYAFSGPDVIKPIGLTRQRSNNGSANTLYRKNSDEALARERDSVGGNTLFRPVVKDLNERVTKVVGNVDDSDYSGDENVEDGLNVSSNGGSAPLLDVQDVNVSESENIPVVETKVALVEKFQVPVAKISLYSDDDSEDSVVLEDDAFSGVIRIPSTEILHRLDSTPKARLTEVAQGDDEHDLQDENASDMEFDKKTVTSDHDLRSEDELVHFGVDERSVDLIVPSDKEDDSNALVTGEEQNYKFKQKQNEDDVHLDEEISEIDVISHLRKCADLIYQREHTDLGSISSAASTAELSCLYGGVELMEPEVTELGYGSSSFGSASAKEKHSSKSGGEQNEDLKHFNERIQEIDVISYQGECMDMVDKTETTAFGSIPFAGETPGCLSGTVNLMEPRVTELGECISKFGSASMDDGDQNSSNTALAFTDSYQISEVSEALAENVPADASEGDSLLESDKETNKAAKSSKQLFEVVEPNPDFLCGGEGFLDQLEVIDDQVVKYSDERVGALGGNADELLSVNGMEKLEGCSNDLSFIFHSTRSNAEARSPNLVETSSLNGEFDEALSEAEKQQLERIQQIRVKYLRLLHLLGCSSDNLVASKVLYLLTVAEERISSQARHLESTRKAAAMELEASKNGHLDFSICILVIGKTGAGKSSTINSIFGEQKTVIDAFEPATTSVKEIFGTIDGVKLKIIDTPGLRTSSIDECINRKILLSVKRAMRKSPPDVILYVDRLDTQIGDLNDLPVLKSVSSYLGSAMWQKSILVLTHATSVPPDGPDGYPLSFEAFVARKSLFVQQLISHSSGEFLITNPGYTIPISLVENHPFAEKNEHGERMSCHGGSWKLHLLLLCYSMKTLSGVSSVVTLQNPLDIRKVFGLPIHSPSRPCFLSSLLTGKDDTCLEGVMNEENRRQQTLCLPLQDMPLELSSQLLTELIFNSSRWNHGYCYDDNSVSSPMAVLDIHTIKTEFKRNETAAEVSLAFLNEKEALEFQVKDRIPLGEGLTLSGNAVAELASQGNTACAASVELCKAYQDYPISLGLSVMKYGGDLTCGCRLQSQFSVGRRSSKLNIRAGLNNKLNGRISIKTSCSDQLQIASALALFPVAKFIFKKVFPQFSKDPLA